MPDRKYNGKPIDSTYQYITERPALLESEKVEYATKPIDNEIKTTGEIDMDYTIEWPENATDPRELNQDQREIIRTAHELDSPSSMMKVQEASSIDKDYNYAKSVLRHHWPEFAAQYSISAEDGDGCKYSNGKYEFDTEKIDEFRKRLLDGETTEEIARDEPYTAPVVRSRAYGECIPPETEEECEYPPLLYSFGEGWIPQDDNTVDREEEKEETTEYAIETAAEVDDVRQRLVEEEESTITIARDYGVSDGLVHNRVTGAYLICDEADCEYPPVEYVKDSGWQYTEEIDDTEENEAKTERPRVVSQPASDGEGETMEREDDLYTIERRERKYTPFLKGLGVGGLLAFAISRAVGK